MIMSESYKSKAPFLASATIDRQESVDCFSCTKNHQLELCNDDFHRQVGEIDLEGI